MNGNEIWDTIERETGRTRPLTTTVAEFARIMDISKITAYRMCERGVEHDGIRSTKLLTATRIPTGEIFRLLGAATVAVGT